MSDYFPADIWREILLKLSVESLIRFTTVCKSWYSLIVSRNFIYAHLSHSKTQSVLRRYDEHDKHDDHYTPLTISKNGSNGCFRIQASSNPKIPFKSKSEFYDIVGSCDGIICFADVDHTESLQPITLWNPSVRNHVFLPQPTTILSESYRVVLGFGVADHVYKVIRLAYYMKPGGNGKSVPQADVFTFGTEMWRSVSGLDIKILVHNVNRGQVLLKGFIHWLGYETIRHRIYRTSILTFDITNEVFGEVLLPDVLASARRGEMMSCLYKIGESLAIVDQGGDFFTNACNVWVMNEYGVKGSWTILYRIDLIKECEKVRSFQVVGFKNDEALLAYEQNETWRDLVSYNLKTKQAKNLGISGTPRSFYIDDYVESFLLLKVNSGSNVVEIGESLER